MNNQGFSTLFMVILLTSASLLIVIQLNLLSMDELELSTLNNYSQENFWQAQSCSEEILLRLRRNNQFAVSQGDFELPINENSCIINITADDNYRTVEITSQKDNFYQNLTVIIQTATSGLIPVSWQQHL